MTPLQQQKAAREFAQRWKGKGYEKGESQIFWSTLLTEVFGVEHVDAFLRYEQQVHLDHTSFIDAVIPSTHVMIEQKSIEKDLGAPTRTTTAPSWLPTASRPAKQPNPIAWRNYLKCIKI